METLNVYNKPLIACCNDPLTGYFRDGFCRTISQDTGTHSICVLVTQEFLDYSFSSGNDLITPLPQWKFPGLKPGDKWCLCISRWLEAKKVGKAPIIILEATHEKTLQYVSLALLRLYSE